jgi:hypothetical protein
MYMAFNTIPNGVQIFGSGSADNNSLVPGMFQNPQLEASQNNMFKGGYISKPNIRSSRQSRVKGGYISKPSRQRSRVRGGKSKKYKKCNCNKNPFF